MPGVTVAKPTEDNRGNTTTVTNMVHLSNKIPSTLNANGNEIQAANQLTDEQLANLPRVRNLFNQFWTEKMQELNKEGEKGSKSINFVKSPSDTMIYAPALMKSPPLPLNHDKQDRHGNMVAGLLL